MRKPTNDAAYSRHKTHPITGLPNPHYQRHGGASGKNRNATVAASFVGYDGEGWTVNDKHEYTLLANSSGRYITNPNGLSTLECLEFLLSQSTAHPQNATHVVYSGNYDVNMMLRDVPKQTIETLWTTGHASWSGYELSYRQRKQFSVREQRTENGKPVWTTTIKNGVPSYQKVYARSIVLWDVAGFYQSTFLKAVKSNIALTADEVDFIDRMKQSRHDFTADQLDMITAYCLLECRLLARLMHDLATKLRHPAIQLTLQRWDGAGSVAAAIYKKQHTKQYMHKQTHTIYCDKSALPISINQAARYAYSGGRIECMLYGYHDAPVYHYDIISAYPAAIATLPCLSCGRWDWTRVFDADSYGLWLVEWDTNLYECINPLFFRSSRGNIYYPAKGAGVYWTPDVDMALKYNDRFTVAGGWVYRQNCVHRPFDFVSSMFAQRRQLKDAGDGAQIVLKLGLNSLYGKMIQQVGYNGGVPPYHQIEWGGYVTSATRARLYDAAMQSPHDIISIMTDGIYSRVPLSLAESSTLGGWEKQIHDAMLSVQAGVYYVRDGGIWSTIKLRGFDAATFPSADTMRHYYTEKREVINLPSTRFIGMGSALANDWSSWRQWPSTDRQLRIFPRIGTGKRHATISEPDGKAAYQLQPTLPYSDPTYTGYLSKPYDVRWGSTLDDGVPELVLRNEYDDDDME